MNLNQESIIRIVIIIISVRTICALLKKEPFYEYVTKILMSMGLWVILYFLMIILHVLFKL